MAKPCVLHKLSHVTVKVRVAVASTSMVAVNAQSVIAVAMIAMAMVPIDALSGCVLANAAVAPINTMSTVSMSTIEMVLSNTAVAEAMTWIAMAVEVTAVAKTPAKVSSVAAEMAMMAMIVPAVVNLRGTRFAGLRADDNGILQVHFAYGSNRCCLCIACQQRAAHRDRECK
ncbi:MAG: hypothetical protein AAF468_10660 [Pseudomonadota bacterium]